MLRAWVSSWLLVPWVFSVAALSCSAGKPSDEGLGPDAGGGTALSTGGTAGSSESSGGSSAGTVSIITMPGGAVDPCAAANLPPGCMTAPAPACGDGMLNQSDEQCDDGNTLPGDCCSGTCQIEPNCSCDANGQHCHSIFVCGDGSRDPGEACDDGNTVSGDGCSADCHTIEPGYSCPTPGQPCIHHYICGDGSVDPNEGCDDGNNTDGDGCSAQCHIEQGYKCDGSPSVCTPTVCGDGKKEGAESCDDGNLIPFDGCSPDCQAEPTCATGSACTSVCGDGIVLGNEQCDDGNLRDGDGCSSTCMIEPGYTCSNDGPCPTQSGVDPTTGTTENICVLPVPTIFRDFNSSKVTGGHPDFQPGFDSAGAVQGLVETMLDADGKPVERADLTATELSNAYLHGQQAFAEWYRDGAPSSGPIPGTIVLWDNGMNGYVNRWGANGEQWKGLASAPDYGTPVYGGPAGSMCDACALGPNQMCYSPCTPWGTTDSCCADIPAVNATAYDGNPLFFPLDTAAGILSEPRSEGKVPSQYGWVGWPWETDVAPQLTPPVTTPIPTSTAIFPSTMHNFSFTTEVKYWFKYTSDLQATLDFTGDDDLWVFLNGHLAVDMGGWHIPLNGTLTINGATIDASAQTTADDNGVGPSTPNPGTATSYGLSDGNVYQVQIFNAEREVQGSTFKLTLAGFNMRPSDCVTDCGDGMVSGTEECDDGVNRGGYNQCAPGCVLGPRCGDGIVQTEYGEVCDDGMNTGAYGGCGPDCQPGPRCGDGIVQTEDGEVCDDGMNTGAYGGCGPNCQLGPYCGDGIVDVPYEQCDDGNDVSGDGCSNCKIDIPVTK